jgi:hypothetical protein
VLLILGLIYTVARELWVRGDEKILWDDLRLVMSQFVMVVFLRLRRFAFRRSVLRPDQYRNVFRRMTIVLLQAALLAGLIAVFPAAKAAAKSLPKLDQVQKSMDSFFNDPHKHKHPSAPADGV